MRALWVALSTLPVLFNRAANTAIFKNSSQPLRDQGDDKQVERTGGAVVSSSLAPAAGGEGSVLLLAPPPHPY